MGIGERVASARTEAGLTQAQLAAAVGLDRSALAKIEVDSRRVSAVELMSIARELGRRMEWFVDAGPPAIASYRAASAEGGTQTIDRELDRLVRDVEFVVGEVPDLIGDVPAERARPASADEAEALAKDARELLGLATDEPAYELGDRMATVGLLVFSSPLDAGADAGTVLLGRGGVTLVNGSLEPGRRRLAVAHELAHFLVADEYTTDWRVAASDNDRTEALFDRFARAILMPEPDLRARWAKWLNIPDEQLRDSAVRAGSHYRVDMATLARRLVELGMVDASEANAVRGVHTRRADIIEKNLVNHQELPPTWVSRNYAQAVLKLYRREVVTADRAVDLLRTVLSRDDLPELRPVAEAEIWTFVS